MNITKEQLDNWYDNKSDHLAEKSGKESVIANHQEFLAQRENWLSLFGQNESQVYLDKEGEHIMVEVESAGENDETAYTLTRQTLPETIQSRNINL